MAAVTMRTAATLALRPSTASSGSKSRSMKCSRRLLTPAPAAVISLIAAVAETSDDPKLFSLPKEEIMATLVKVEDTINQLEEVRNRLSEYSENYATIVNETLKPQLDAALPYLQEASELVLKVTSPMVSDAPGYAKLALQMAGLDPTPVLSAYKIATKVLEHATHYKDEAGPLASEILQLIKTSDPFVITAAAGALPALFFLLPPIWSIISFHLRGYKGEFSPLVALYMASTHDYVMMDIRSETEKQKEGIPSFPPNFGNKIVFMPMEDLPNKLKELVKDSKKVEADIAALKISNLKQINKSSKIIVMDSYCDAAKIVARTLTKAGFKNIWVVTGGFSGDRGWLWCRLGTDPYSISTAEVLSPSTVIPAGAVAAAAARFTNSSVLRRK